MIAILDNKTYTGSRYTYGFRNRPPGYAHNPNDFIHGTEQSHPDFRWGTLDFPRELGEDAYRYELTLVKMCLTDEDMQEFMYHCCSYWKVNSAPGVGQPWSGVCLMKEVEESPFNGCRKYRPDTKTIYIAESTNDGWWVVQPFSQSLPEHIFKF